MIAVVGLGGAGGNIADEAVKHGFVAGAINFSQKDLDSLEEVSLKLKLIGSEGVGHNRDIAIQLLSEHHEIVTQFIKENFLSNPYVKIIIFAFSTGGGSGSGISPILLDILSNTFTDKTFVAMPILPDLSEVTVSQANCLNTMEELSKLDICILPLDNQQVASGSIGKNKIFKATNEKAMDLLAQLVQYTDKHSKNGVFDQRDLLTILQTKGIATIAEANISTISSGQPLSLSSDGVAEIVKESWGNTVFAPIENDQIIRAGVIFDAQETFMGFINHHEIFSQFKSGLPIDLFEGFYHDQKGKIITILSGLAWSKGRMEAIDKSMSQQSAKVEAVLKSTENQNFQSKASSLMGLIRKPNNKEAKPVTDILKKYRR